ncbi:hypothetical protein E2C01_000162 [Portunus trituberculatus]|uniref:Uncharacterized protein n=1 Tax=Portunus trituberculatus TaxID=210409 RepID=A0A5B7CEE5_PORTR|nr:hypothetical protein [Portunus trituberculatus]
MQKQLYETAQLGRGHTSAPYQRPANDERFTPGQSRLGRGCLKGVTVVRARPAGRQKLSKFGSPTTRTGRGTGLLALAVFFGMGTKFSK